MTDDFTPLTGRCMCGAVEVSTAAPFVGALYCPCKRCQRRSGTTRSMTALCPAGAFSVTAGQDKVRVWDPGRRLAQAFCVDCGSHTHTISPDDSKLVAIRLGCLVADPGIRPQVHQIRRVCVAARAAARGWVAPVPRATRSHRAALSSARARVRRRRRPQRRQAGRPSAGARVGLSAGCALTARPSGSMSLETHARDRRTPARASRGGVARV
jgi:hypothetical protein